MDITVVDALMGTGKTHWAHQFMKSNPDGRYLYITPLLSETDRCTEACLPEVEFFNPVAEYDPVAAHGRKAYSFLRLLEGGRDIAATHQLFKIMDDEAANRMQRLGYTLIIDEALDVVEVLSESPADIRLLLDAKVLVEGTDGVISWDADRYAEAGDTYKGRFNNLATACRQGGVVRARERFLLWRFPPQFLGLFKKVYILTYLFEGNLMAAYLKANKVPYQVVGLDRDRGLVDLAANDTWARKQELASHIRVEKDVHFNAIGKMSGRHDALTMYWYEHATKEQQQDLKRALTVLAKLRTDPLDNVMWTCPKVAAKWLGSTDWPFIDRAKLSDSEKSERLEDGSFKYPQHWVASGIRATNDLEHKSVLVFLSNIRQDPTIIGYFADRGVPVDENFVALNTLIQWIWRSRIRKAPPEDVYLFLPSERMRRILIDWINKTDKQINRGEWSIKIDEDWMAALAAAAIDPASPVFEKSEQFARYIDGLRAKGVESIPSTDIQLAIRVHRKKWTAFMKTRRVKQFMRDRRDKLIPGNPQTYRIFPAYPAE